MKTEIILTPEQEIMFLNFYRLTAQQIQTIKDMVRVYGQTVDEISRKFNITPPDVSRILHPPKDYGMYTAEEKKKHWLAGQKRSATVKKQNDERKAAGVGILGRR